MGLVPLLGTLMTGVVTPPEEIERLRKLGKAKKVSSRLHRSRSHELASREGDVDSCGSAYA